MTEAMPENPDDFIKESKLYKLMKDEASEIDRLKWLESEKAGFDIGREKAFYTWVMNHKKHWEQFRRVPGAKDFPKSSCAE